MLVRPGTGLQGHSLALNLEFERPLSAEEAIAALAGAPGVELCDIPTPSQPREATSRLWAGSAGTRPLPHGLSLFVVGDNLRKGAALNAVQIAEVLAGIA